MNIIITLLILGIIITIHELGHFLTAKFFKMPVEEFALGMGPAIYSYEGVETKYSLRAIPIGGYVNIQGMEVDSVVKNGFNSKPAYQRLVVLAAGVIMNFILAYIIVLGSTLYNGEIIVSDKAVVGRILEDSKASEELQVGDKILSIEGKKIDKWSDISRVNKELDGKVMKFEIDRKGTTISKDIDLTYNEQTKDYYIGILPEYHNSRYGFVEGLKQAGVAYKNLFVSIVTGFKQLVSGKVSPKDMSGPVGIVKIVGSVSNEGAGILFWLTALLSINIGFLNLLPFPALDGGRILFILFEVVGIKVNKKLEERLHMGGMIILFGAIIAITFNDIMKLFK